MAESKPNGSKNLLSKDSGRGESVLASEDIKSVEGADGGKNKSQNEEICSISGLSVSEESKPVSVASTSCVSQSNLDQYKKASVTCSNLEQNPPGSLTNSESKGATGGATAASRNVKDSEFHLSKNLSSTETGSENSKRANSSKATCRSGLIDLSSQTPSRKRLSRSNEGGEQNVRNVDSPKERRKHRTIPTKDSSSEDERTEKEIEELGPEMEGEVILGEQIHPPRRRSPPMDHRRRQRRHSPTEHRGQQDNFPLQLIFLVAQLGLGGPIGPIFGHPRRPGGLGRMDIEMGELGIDQDLGIGHFRITEDDEGISVNDNPQDTNEVLNNRREDEIKLFKKDNDMETDETLGDEGFGERSQTHTTVTMEPRALSPTTSLLLYNRNAEGDTELHTLIINRDVDGIKNILSRAPDHQCLDVVNNVFQTPLILAAIQKLPEVVRYLLVAGVNSTYQDRKGDTVLHIAVKQNDSHTAMEIVKLVSETEYRNRLTANYRSRYYRPTQKLLNQRNDEGLAAIHYAVINNNVEIVDILRNAGVNLDQQTGKTGDRPIHLAVRLRRWHIIRYLVETCKINFERGNFKNVPPLILASSLRYYDIAEYLVNNGADSTEMNVPIVDTDERDTERNFYNSNSDDDDDEPETPVPAHTATKVRFVQE